MTMRHVLLESSWLQTTQMGMQLVDAVELTFYMTLFDPTFVIYGC